MQRGKKETSHAVHQIQAWTTTEQQSVGKFTPVSMQIIAVKFTEFSSKFKQKFV